MVVAITMKYFLHTIDNQHENPWENKNVYLLYAELITGEFKLVLISKRVVCFLVKFLDKIFQNIKIIYGIGSQTFQHEKRILCW